MRIKSSLRAATPPPSMTFSSKAEVSVVDGHTKREKTERCFLAADSDHLGDSVYNANLEAVLMIDKTIGK